MIIEIDPGAGFCFGVKRAISLAEDKLQQGGKLFSLGQIVHNKDEEQRLNQLGMTTITHDQMDEVKDNPILIRAHGEPKSTYQKALKNNIELIDATCPIVLKLQNEIRKCWLEGDEDNRQIVVFGKKGHPEVIGLQGNIDNQAIIIENISDIEKIDFSRPIFLFSQTTADEELFDIIKNDIAKRLNDAQKSSTPPLHVTKSICSQVKNRKNQVITFASKHDLIIFVGGKNSSNGRYLFSLCKAANTNSFFIENETNFNPGWLTGVKSIGITGATSTPDWLLEKVKSHINTLIQR
ncbi:MAG TPA: 4-hydroxy-3-methylbut-2-enyl diphosphate reductase [Bacteroidales bacterium]|nr:MAG: 4-hydroxy-3-methylbut-2-enyl diphosphate reductase [Bacteroidetes bacterium ADurb.Bin041]HNV50099.1 4-hydroxy-3-methylbut-2-enyl diphosphate reductase [Bacteroidales bacterium]HNY59516.1 4-hydroxy-3-methylbut-2-enyl diphosphate reductase [Bacteroidales bacterium]HPA12313.1 4-hydroxy-3-methylbut-2-enyl diphosphate reductase [Bacteroidales bacterium]HPW43363.1 4-hydroxy-3-methylbut-2-enyl diphosphate reductase [Bacteroidales bacterium]